MIKLPHDRPGGVLERLRGGEAGLTGRFCQGVL